MEIFTSNFWLNDAIEKAKNFYLSNFEDMKTLTKRQKVNYIMNGVLPIALVENDVRNYLVKNI